MAKYPEGHEFNLDEIEEAARISIEGTLTRRREETEASQREKLNGRRSRVRVKDLQKEGNTYIGELRHRQVSKDSLEREDSQERTSTVQGIRLQDSRRDQGKPYENNYKIYNQKHFLMVNVIIH